MAWARPAGQTAGKTLAVPLGEPGHHQRLHGLVVVVQVLLRRVGSVTPSASITLWTWARQG